MADLSAESKAADAKKESPVAEPVEAKKAEPEA